MVEDVNLTCIDGEAVAIAMGDGDGTLHGREALDVAHRESKTDMAFVVGLPVLHEEGNFFDVDPSTRDLPKACMRRLTATTRVALVAGLFEEFASQARTHLADLMGLLSLIRTQRAPSPPHPLLR